MGERGGKAGHERWVPSAVFQWFLEPSREVRSHVQMIWGWLDVCKMSREH